MTNAIPPKSKPALPTTMQAAVYRRYGPAEVIKLETLPTPTLGEADAERVLVRVYHSSLNPIDYIHRSGFLLVRPSAGWLRPYPQSQVAGVDLAGEVVGTGAKVTRFKPGDLVYGTGWGAHAEYVKARESYLAPMPRNLTFAEAAAIPLAAQTALQALRDVGQIQAGQKVLVNGASGGIGHFAVQLAKHFGAEVTAVCSTRNQAWVKALGADHMIDYTQQDFTRSAERYDLIYDSVGKRTYLSCKPRLMPGGIFIGENPFKARFQLLQMIWARLRKDPQLGSHLTQSRAQDLEFLRTLVEAGKLKPVLETTYPLAQMAQAHRHGETGHSRGKVGIEVHKAQISPS